MLNYIHLYKFLLVSDVCFASIIHVHVHLHVSWHMYILCVVITVKYNVHVISVIFCVCSMKNKQIINYGIIFFALN